MLGRATGVGMIMNGEGEGADGLGGRNAAEKVWMQIQRCRRIQRWQQSTAMVGGMKTAMFEVEMIAHNRTTARMKSL